MVECNWLGFLLLHLDGFLWFLALEMIEFMGLMTFSHGLSCLFSLLELSLDLLVNVFLDVRFGFLIQILQLIFLILLENSGILENIFIRITVILMEGDLLSVTHHLRSLQVILLKNLTTHILNLNFGFLDKFCLVESLQILIVTEVDFITLIIKIGQLNIFGQLSE